MLALVKDSQGTPKNLCDLPQSPCLLGRALEVFRKCCSCEFLVLGFFSGP